MDFSRIVAVSLLALYLTGNFATTVAAASSDGAGQINVQSSKPKDALPSPKKDVPVISDSEFNSVFVKWTDCVSSSVGRSVGMHVRATGEKGDFDKFFKAADKKCDKNWDRLRKKAGSDPFFKSRYDIQWAMFYANLYKANKHLEIPKKKK